jgi:hypothetical protein
MSQTHMQHLHESEMYFLVIARTSLLRNVNTLTSQLSHLSQPAIEHVNQ